jgi:hypothetical protein
MRMRWRGAVPGRSAAPVRPRQTRKRRRRRPQPPVRGRASGGQSTVETVAVLPVMVTVALAIGHVLAAGLAHELAGHAAEAGAIATLRGGDAQQAARAALPEWADDRVEVRVVGRRVRVRLEPPSVIPGAGAALASTKTADAGPATAAATAEATLRALQAPGEASEPDAGRVSRSP